MNVLESFLFAGEFLSCFALEFVAFDTFFPFFFGFTSDGYGVFKTDDFNLLDTTPDDDFSVTDGAIDVDAVDRVSVEHANKPFSLVLSCDCGDASLGGCREGEDCSVCSVFGDEVLKGDDFFGGGESGFLEDTLTVAHLKGENHFRVVDVFTLDVEGETIFLRSLPHAEGIWDGEREGEYGE